MTYLELVERVIEELDETEWKKAIEYNMALELITAPLNGVKK